MANSKPVGVAYSDPALTSGTTIDSATITNTTIGGTNTLSGNTLTSPTISNPVITGVWSETPTVVAAAGATQGTATAIAASTVVVTVTASSEGVKLPAAATGKIIQVFMPGTVGVKVYPGTGAQIDASSTNSAVVLAAGKANIYLARNTTKWVTMKGA